MKIRIVKSSKLTTENFTPEYYLKDESMTKTIPIISLSKARLCGTFHCGTIHQEQNCPKCNSGEFLFIESILNQENKFKSTYRYCSSCNAKYKDVIVVSSKDEEGNSIDRNICPACGADL